jgi:hypothetical protein
MSLLKRIKRLGKRLGLLRASKTRTRKEPTKVSTQVVSLEELISGIPELDIPVSSATRVDLPAGFDGILSAAGVHSPPHGWTVDRLEEFLRGKCGKLTFQQAQQRTLEALARDDAPTEDIVRDAVARDQALDAFERFAKEKLEAQRKKRQEHLARLKEQLEALQKRIDVVRSEQRQEQEEWRAWRKSKVDYEKQMAWALSFIMEKPLITIDEEE